MAEWRILVCVIASSMDVSTELSVVIDLPPSPLDEETASSRLMNQPVFFLFHAFIAIATLALTFFEVFRLCRLFPSKHLLSSTLGTIWKTQMYLSVQSTVLFFAFGFLRQFPLTWQFFYASNETWLPPFVERSRVYTYEAQVFGVFLMCLERLGCSLFGRGRVDRLLWPLLPLLHLSLPLLSLLPFFEADPPFFYYSEDLAVASIYIFHHSEIQLNILGPLNVIIAAVSGCLLIAATLIFLWRHRARNEEWRSEWPLSALAAAHFASLLAAVAFSLATKQADQEEDIDRLLFLTTYVYVVVNFILSTVSPWAVLLIPPTRRLLFGSLTRISSSHPILSPSSDNSSKINAAFAKSHLNVINLHQ